MNKWIRCTVLSWLLLLPGAVLAQEATELPETPFEPVRVTITHCKENESCVRIEHTSDEDGQTLTIITDFASFDTADGLADLTFEVEGLDVPLTLGDFFNAEQLGFINENTCFRITTAEDLPLDSDCESAQVFTYVLVAPPAFWQLDPEGETLPMAISLDDELLGTCEADWLTCHVGTEEALLDVSLYPILESQLPGAEPSSNDLMHATSWTEAQAFCESYGYRLPTQKEWLALWSSNLIRYPEALMEDDFVTYEWTGTRVEDQDEQVFVAVQQPDAWGGKRTMSALNFELYSMDAPPFITGRIYFRCVRSIEDETE